jgi:3-oxoacyl-[acyl-carrier protein] reductase
MNLLKDKVALVTGGSRGIGSAIVRAFAAEGAHVAFTYLSSEKPALEIQEELTAMGVKAKAYKSDASSFTQSEELVKNVLVDFEKIDVLVNNAGVTRDNLMLRMTEEQWDTVININLKSLFNLTKQVMRPMMKNRGGSIINISSVVGDFGNPGQANYAASKAGVFGFTKSIAKEVGSRNIRCNAIAPGFIKTDMTDQLDDSTKDGYLTNVPLKRFGEGQEIADACIFLASDMSSYMTGQTMSICGGLNM